MQLGAVGIPGVSVDEVDPANHNIPGTDDAGHDPMPGLLPLQLTLIAVVILCQLCQSCSLCMSVLSYKILEN